MRVKGCRLSPLRLGLITLTLLLVLCLYLLWRHTFHPDYFLLSSTHLSATPLHDVFSLDWVARDYFQPRSTLLSPLPTFLILPSRDCESSTFMVVLVSSHVTNFTDRILIRETWGGAVEDNRWPSAQIQVPVKVFFVLGTDGDDSPHSEILKLQVIHEAKTHDDLIMGDFRDTYRNLTTKTLTGLNWVRHHCTHCHFVMKMDQDTLVDFPRLTDFLLREQEELHNAVIGKMFFNSPRLDNGKWKVSPEEYPLSVYPTYAAGPSYIISRDSVDRIVNVSQYMTPVSMEDVHVSGILAKTVGVRRLLMPQIQNMKMDSLCGLVGRDPYYVSMTVLTPHQVKQVWTMLTVGKCLLT